MKTCANFTFIFLAALICGCATTQTETEENYGRSLLNATLWAQTSEEFSGATIGAYRTAKFRLDQALADKTWSALPEQMGAAGIAELPPALILDIDETVLDNYPFEAWLAKNNREFGLPNWNRWIADAKAGEIAGAKEFISYAVERGVKVFFVTNRDYKFDVDLNDDGVIGLGEKQVVLEPYTIKNMEALGLLPKQTELSVEDSLLLKGENLEWGSDKTSRREAVAASHRVLLLIGDSLADFIGYPAGDPKKYDDIYKLPSSERQKFMAQYNAYWGDCWIVIPNAAYGSWDRAPFNFDYALSPAEKDLKKMEALKSWR